jgi:hypothetical protein
LFVTFFLLISILLWGQQSSPQSTDDPDSFFSENQDQGKETKPEAGDENKGPDLLQEVLKGNVLTIGADIYLLAGYSPGLNYLPGDPGDIHYDDMVLAQMTAGLSFDARITPELRLYQRITTLLPDLTLQIDEVFCDYSILNTVFLRIGRQNITWGISPNYPYTNLLARLPDKVTNTVTADSFAFKMNIPIGVGGFEAVMYTRNTFWENQKPRVSDIGFGGRFNLALDNIDFNIGGFFQKEMFMRFFYSLKTTLFGSIESYTEGVLTFPTYLQPVFSANAGMYVDLFSKAMRLNLEYFFNGEETGLQSKGAAFSFIPGHNVALNVSFSFFDHKFKLFLAARYNITHNTGLLLPGMSLDVVPNLTFSLAVPYIIGPVTGGYFVNNTDNNNRRICLVLAIVLKGNI